MAERLIDHLAFRPGRTPEIVAMTVALANGHAQVFEHGQTAEELIDLKSAREAPPRAVGLAKQCNVFAIEHDAARMRLERPRNQVDEGGFAGTVRTNQGT